MNILIQGKKHSIISQFQIEKKLDLGFYNLVWDSFGNISLEQLFVPSLPEKFVDIKKSNRDIILAAYKATKTNIGVAFLGIKGTGKSVDAKKLVIDSKLPVIVIDKPVPRNVDLSLFLASIEQEIVVFIDEFGKNFKSYDDSDADNQSQENLLSILDGINSEYKRLFVFTTNENLNDFMINRPSRIKFLIHYDYLTVEETRILLKDKLINESYLPDLLENLDTTNLTIDILFSIVGLINTINKPYSAFKDIFNYVVSNTYEFVAVKSGEKFFAKMEGNVSTGKTVYIEGYGHYPVRKNNQVEIEDKKYIFSKTFDNLTHLL